MSLHSRLAALEKKRRASNAQDNKILGILDYCSSQSFPEWNGIHTPGVQVIGVIGGTRLPPESFAERCQAQQRELLAMLAEKLADLERTDGNANPHEPAFAGDELAPGASPLKFRYETDPSGREWQIDVSTGQKWKV